MFDDYDHDDGGGGGDDVVDGYGYDDVLEYRKALLRFSGRRQFPLTDGTSSCAYTELILFMCAVTFVLVAQYAFGTRRMGDINHAYCCHNVLYQFLFASSRPNIHPICSQETHQLALHHRSSRNLLPTLANLYVGAPRFLVPSLLAGAAWMGVCECVSTCCFSVCAAVLQSSARMYTVCADQKGDNKVV